MIPFDSPEEVVISGCHYSESFFKKENNLNVLINYDKIKILK